MARWLGEQPEGDADLGGAPREAFEATDALHYNLEIEINPSAGTLSGTNTMTIRSLVDGLTEFTFRLRTQYTITSALINGSTPVSVTTLGTTTRRATLDRAYNAGEEFTLTIAYNGTPVSVGFGSIEFDTQNGQPLVSTLSQPYYSYSWWPCKDGDFAQPGDNSDKATLELALIAPSTMRSVSNGLLLGVDNLSGNRRRYRWASNYPTSTYLVFFSSTNYTTWTQTYDYGAGTMPVEFSIYPADDNPTNRAAWEQVLVMLETYRPIFGLYPFINEKYGIYQFNFGGGMEHQTYTGQGGFWEWVTAHELAHQWWGDSVTCRTWHDIWLNEGFATYSEALWEERRPGSSGLPALFAAMSDRRPAFVGDSVYVYDTSNINRIFDYDLTYLKAGWVLHQLRHVVGDAPFFDLLAGYRAAYEGSAPTTDDFAAVCSSVHGQDLSWFFDEWVYGIGAPAYQYGWQTAQINGQHYLRLYINQVQDPSYGMYIMPIDVRVNRSSGNETHTVWNDADPEHFVIPISSAATGVVLDEFDWILTTSKTQVSYVNGPPKIVQAQPGPGATFPSDGGPSQATVTFSENVTASAARFSVVGDNSGAVPFTYAYTPANFTATLTFSGPRGPDRYTVTVDDAIASSAAGIALDGEIVGTTLPSGDGQAGGDAVYTFRVAPPCPADLDGDGQVALGDLAILLAHYGTTSGASPDDGDLDLDGDVDLSDLAQFLAAFGTSCT